MKNLSDILVGIHTTEVIGSIEQPVAQLRIDSRAVGAGDVFVAIRGTLSDGHNYIDTAIAQGATTIICETIPTAINAQITYIQVTNTGHTLGLLAANYYEHPSTQMTVVGVTGTNGKTSVATLLYRLYRSLGHAVGLLSTVQNQINETILDSTHTTPDAVSLQALMRQMADAGCTYCFMEVSSHALDQSRVVGVAFAGGVFTNITHDHLDYHKTFDNYIKAKKSFFDQMPASAFALVNTDDRNGMVMLQNCKAHKHTYALRTPADYKGKVIENTIAGLHVVYNGAEMHTRLIGEFNAYNMLAVYGTAMLLESDSLEVLTALSALSPPEGRFDQIISPVDGVVGIIDYAHTPDALKNVLHTIQAIRKGTETLITLIGCGGDRDTTKRPLMGAVSAHLSDRCILTSDNPRTEDPQAILDQMLAGIDIVDRKKVVTIADRREAIRSATMMAKRGDIILLAGKGHEKYQDIQGVKHPFDDKQILTQTFTELGK
jgi:UDP-N-acetylmuramoyl-L-alanyl-D-glutamate--2,6-diaminopimelate ligase